MAEEGTGNVLQPLTEEHTEHTLKDGGHAMRFPPECEAFFRVPLPPPGILRHIPSHRRKEVSLSLQVCAIRSPHQTTSSVSSQTRFDPLSAPVLAPSGLSCLTHILIYRILVRDWFTLDLHQD